ncbi:MAG: outer membrane protein assembly factor BamA, partial [Kiloniellales bacterium]
VERIDIQGNVRTLDRVIRREFRLVEGDAFNTAKLRRSRQRIQNLGFFRTVDVEALPGSTPDKTVLAVEIEEQSTGDLTFGAGFSSTAGPVGNVGIRERNLLGRGQDLRLGFTLSGKESQIDLSFTEPYFLGRNLSAGFDAFRIVSDDDQRSFDLERTGGSLRTGFSWTENIRQVLRYTLEQRNLTDLDANASDLVRQEQGKVLESTVSQELAYDTRDNRFDPREGSVVRLRNEVAGLGGDVAFLKSSLLGAQYYSIFEDLTVSVRGEVGNIIGLGEDTRISDRFLLGGQNLRGFEFAGVGPRDTGGSDDPLGGKQFYTGTLEFIFPVGVPDEFDIRGRVFTDIGSTWGLDGTALNIRDEKSPRVSAGVGFSWVSPVGPIVVDLGFALIKEDFDNTELVNFNFGTQF